MIFHLYLNFFIDHLYFQSRSQRNIEQQCTAIPPSTIHHTNAIIYRQISQCSKNPNRLSHSQSCRWTLPLWDPSLSMTVQGIGETRSCRFSFVFLLVLIVLCCCFLCWCCCFLVSAAKGFPFFCLLLLFFYVFYPIVINIGKEGLVSW